MFKTGVGVEVVGWIQRWIVDTKDVEANIFGKKGLAQVGFAV